MKLLTSIVLVLVLGLFAFTGCEDKSAPAPTKPSEESHNADDGHDHAGESEDARSEGEVHSDHDH